MGEMPRVRLAGRPRYRGLAADAARGLTHQAKTATGPGSAAMTVRAVDDELEAQAVVTPYASGRDRSKVGPQPGEAPHAACPGDARHLPRHDLPGVTASVRKDTPQRPGPRCPAQRAGSRALRRPA